MILGRHASRVLLVAASILPPAATVTPLRACQHIGHGFERQLVTLGAEAADHALGGQRNVRMLPERLAAENVRQMHFDDRQLGRLQGIEQRIEVCE